MKNPLLLPALALAFGIGLSRSVLLETRELIVVLLLISLLSCIATVECIRNAPVGGDLSCMEQFGMIVRLGWLVAVLFAGALVEALDRPRPAPHMDTTAREVVLLAGCVVSPPAYYEGRDQFVMELAPGARARVSLTIRESEKPPDLHYGQRVELEARVRPTRNFQNPGAFDYRAYLARLNIYWSASVPAGSPIAVQPGRCGSRWMAAIFGLRTAALNRIEQLYSNNAYATGIMEATLIGETSKLERIWTENFRRTGTYHMLVIDGLHITVLAAFLLFLLRLCFVPELNALAITAAGAWLYALISGWNAPAVRAAGGFSLYLAARYFYRRGRLMNLLAATAMVYLIADPEQLFEPGFQLSFLAVAAIAALALPALEATSAVYARAVAGIMESSRDPRLPPRAAQFRLEMRLVAETLHYCLRIPEAWAARMLALAARVVFYAWEVAVVSTFIQIGVALPMAIYFHRISLTGFSANVLAVPLLGLVVPIGFLAVFTGWHFPAMIAESLLRAGEKVADWHTRFEPNWRVPDPPLWLALAFSGGLLLLAWTIRRSRVWTAISGALVGALFALVYWHPFHPMVRPGELEMTAIDVGQGDSLLISFPDSKLALVDGGGVLTFGRRGKPRFDIGEDVVSPYLWRRSIRKLDVVVMTHAHDDHAQGLPAIIENFHPDELWTGATPASAVWSAVLEKARAEEVKIVSMESGRSFGFGGAQIEVLSPASGYVPSETPRNNDSLAVRIRYKDRSFLLTGDMEKPMEARLLGTGTPIRSDVLKVGHHGSNTSSTVPFLDAVSPSLAVISDGFENSFRHPHPQVLDRLAQHHAGVLRTDLSGMITIWTDGRGLSVETFGGNRASHGVYPVSGSAVF